MKIKERMLGNLRINSKNFYQRSDKDRNPPFKNSNSFLSVLTLNQDLAREDKKDEVQNQKREQLREKSKPKNKVVLGSLKRYSYFILIVGLLCVIISFLIFQNARKQQALQMLENRLSRVMQIEHGLQVQLKGYVEKANKLEKNLTRAKTVLLKSKNLIGDLLFAFKNERIARLQLEDKLKSTQGMLISVMKDKEVLKEKKGLEEVFAKPPLVIKGDIVMVSKKAGFCVVSLGKKDNLAPGMILLVRRQGPPIARLQVTYVAEKVAGTRIIPSWRDISIVKEGDQVEVSSGKFY